MYDNLYRKILLFLICLLFYNTCFIILICLLLLSVFLKTITIYIFCDHGFRKLRRFLDRVFPFFLNYLYNFYNLFKFNFQLFSLFSRFVMLNPQYVRVSSMNWELRFYMQFHLAQNDVLSLFLSGAIKLLNDLRNFGSCFCLKFLKYSFWFVLVFCLCRLTFLSHKR